MGTKSPGSGDGSGSNAMEKNLRHQAEDKVRGNIAQTPAGIEELSPEAMRQSNRELQVNQLELEMQNEDLIRTQEGLETSRTRYFDMFDLAPVGYLMVSEKGQILEANLTIATLLGVSREALVSQKLAHFILPEDEDSYYSQVNQLVATGASREFELRLVNKDGGQIWVQIEAVLVRDADGVILCHAVLSDITRRKRAEELLRRSAEIQTVLRDIAETAVLASSLDELYQAVNRLVERVLPVKFFHIQLLDETTGEIVVPFRGDEVSSIPKRRPTGKGLTEYIMRLGRASHLKPAEIVRLREAGEYTLEMAEELKMLHYIGAPLIDSQGKAFGELSLFLQGDFQTFHPDDVKVLSIIGSQISLAIERKRAEQSVKSSQVRYRALMEQSFEALAVVDLQTQEVVEVNHKFTELLGYSLPADSPLYVQQFVLEAKSGLDRIDNITLLKQHVLQAESQIYRHKKGIEVPVEHAGTVISIDERDYLLASMRDMTAERRRQAEMTHDIDVAQRVQQGLLPDLPESSFVTIRSIYHPSKSISGDSYLLEWDNEGKLLRGFLIDVSGHGLATALQTASINVLLREATTAKLPLIGHLWWANARASKYFTDGAYAAILGFELDLSLRELRYVGAGITQFYANGKKIETPGMFVGLWDPAEFIAGKIAVDEGDTFHFLTDGFTDALAQPENTSFYSPDGKDFEADVASLERLAGSGKLRDDATGVCLKINALL